MKAAGARHARCLADVADRSAVAGALFCVKARAHGTSSEEIACTVGREQQACCAHRVQVRPWRIAFDMFEPHISKLAAGEQLQGGIQRRSTQFVGHTTRLAIKSAAIVSFDIMRAAFCSFFPS